MSDINRITCVDCGKHIVTEEREHVGGKIKVIEGSYENGYYDGEDDLFYCTECAKKNKWIWGDQMLKKCLLKRFGILEVNKYVEYRIHSNPELLYVYFDNDWHTVPKEDVDIVKM